MVRFLRTFPAIAKKHLLSVVWVVDMFLVSGKRNTTHTGNKTKVNIMIRERKLGPYGMDKLLFESCGLVLYRNRNGLFDTCGRLVTIREVAEMLRLYDQSTN